MRFERPQGPLPGIGEIGANFSAVHLANGVVGFLFAATGPVAIILAVGATGGLSEADIASWLFGGFALSGLLTLALSITYRQPLAMGWSIPGTVIAGTALTHLTFAEAIGAYLATGVLMLALGLSGWVRAAMALVPMPIVMAMVAGVFLRFGLAIVAGFADAFWIALAAVATFIAVSALPRLARLLPPVLAALVAGVVVTLMLGQFALDAPLTLTLADPILYAPRFTAQAMIELVIPLAISVLVLQNAQGITVLKAAGHDAPTNVLTVACGAGSLVYALVGTVNTCVTGPVNAILSASGPRQHHYIGAIVWGVLALAFGLFAPTTTRLALALPASFIGVLGGLAMLRVLEGAFRTAFAGRFTLGALVTFIVTLSEITILNVGAAFWGLVLGYLVSRLLEPADFATENV